ncbi:unnamed protein product [Prorocentrum cordatum]|uniref:EF-hand domain-containing protein n=1 Tax=Prorocentrum cordatum TaxID=2364126 RepID=A0ABN9SCS5_9DINO|nr:unnamed protein product [Polarella glacialis]
MKALRDLLRSMCTAAWRSRRQPAVPLPWPRAARVSASRAVARGLARSESCAAPRKCAHCKDRMSRFEHPMVQEERRSRAGRRRSTARRRSSSDKGGRMAPRATSKGAGAINALYLQGGGAYMVPSSNRRNSTSRARVSIDPKAIRNLEIYGRQARIRQVEKFTPEMVEEVKDLFSRFDKSGDNELDRAEFGPLMRMLGPGCSGWDWFKTRLALHAGSDHCILHARRGAQLPGLLVQPLRSALHRTRPGGEKGLPAAATPGCPGQQLAWVAVLSLLLGVALGATAVAWGPRPRSRALGTPAVPAGAPAAAAGDDLTLLALEQAKAFRKRPADFDQYREMMIPGADVQDIHIVHGQAGPFILTASAVNCAGALAGNVELADPAIAAPPLAAPTPALLAAATPGALAFPGAAAPAAAGGLAAPRVLAVVPAVGGAPPAVAAAPAVRAPAVPDAPAEAPQTSGEPAAVWHWVDAEDVDGAVAFGAKVAVGVPCGATLAGRAGCRGLLSLPGCAGAGVVVLRDSDTAWTAKWCAKYQVKEGGPVLHHEMWKAERKLNSTDFGVDIHETISNLIEAMGSNSHLEVYNLASAELGYRRLQLIEHYCGGRSAEQQ